MAPTLRLKVLKILTYKFLNYLKPKVFMVIVSIPTSIRTNV